MRYLMIISLTLIAACVAFPTPWTDKHGQPIQVKCVSCRNGIVRMKMPTGKIIRVSLWNLSKTDQAFIVDKGGYEIGRAHV